MLRAAKNTLMMCGRRSGKTRTAVMRLGLAALSRPGKYRWIGPSQQQVDDVAVPMFSEVFRGLPGFYSTRRRVILPGGSTIYFAGADNVAGRGPGLCGAVIDEAAHLHKRVWSEETQPSLRDNKGWVLMCSTPNGFNWFTDLRDQILNRPDWQVFGFPTWSNPNITHAECLQDLIPGYNNAAWRQEYLGQPTASEYAKWPAEWFDSILVSTIPRRFQRCAVSIDFSEGGPASDWQAVCVLGYNPHDEHHYIDVTTLRASIQQVLECAKSKCDQYRAEMVVYDASGGQALVRDQILALWKNDQSRPIFCGIKEHEHKETRIHRLSWPLHKKAVSVLDNIGGREYVREGRDFPDGEHDDALDAHEMAWRGLIAGGNL